MPAFLRRSIQEAPKQYDMWHTMPTAAVDPMLFKTRVLRMTVLPVFLALLVAVVLGAQIQYLIETTAWLTHTERVIAQANGVRATILDAHSGLRGFLLTDDPKFLEPFQLGRDTLPTAFDELRASVSDNHEQVARLDHVLEIHGTWIRFAETELQLRRDGGDYLGPIRAGDGKRIVDMFRSELDAFIAAEEAYRGDRFVTAHRATRIVMWSTLGLALALGAVLGIAGRRQLLAITDTYAKALATADDNAAALRGSEERYRLLVEGVTDYAILGLDIDGRLVTWSAGGEKIFGYTSDEMLGCDVSLLLADSEPDRDARRDLLAEAIGAGAHESTRLCRRRDGTFFHAEMVVSAFRSDDGLPIGFSLLLRDVTTRMALEDEVRSQKERLEERVIERTADLESAYRMLEMVSANHQAARIEAQRSAVEVQDLYDNAPCGYHSLDENGVFLRINETELQWLGLDREETIGKLSFRDVLTTEGQRIFDEQFPAFKKDGRVQDLEFEMVRRDGGTMTVLLSATAICDADGRYLASRSTVFDITQRRRNEFETARLRERYAAFVEASSMVLFTLDATGLGTSKSAAAEWEAVTGQARNVDDVTWWIDSVHPDDRKRVRDAFEHAIATKTGYDIEMRVRTISGASRVYASKAVPIYERDGSFREWVGTLTDVTDRAEAERQVRDLNVQLESQLKELHAVNAELDAFAYSVSHDLRAPLRAIDGFSRILAEDCAANLGPDGNEHIVTIRENTVRMGNLIDDLLAFSRLGRAKLAVETVDAQALVRHVLDSLMPGPDARRAKVVLGDLPPCLADPDLLKRVFENLIANALKYSGKRDNPTIEIGSVPPESPGDGVVYFVRDNGVGFDMRYVDKLFGVFQRLHRSEDYEGTGVGLAIVHRIVSRHGGRAWADGAVDAGATFSFSIPVEGPS